MSSRENYVEAYFIRQVGKNLDLPTDFLRQDELIDAIAGEMQRVLEGTEAAPLYHHDVDAGELFDKMLTYGVLEVEEDPVAGHYLRFRPEQYSAFRVSYVSNNDILARASRVGQRYFPDVFRALVGGTSTEQIAEREVLVELSAPASDRVVRFSHNQSDEFAKETDKIIEAVSAKNELSGPSGFRELIIGQLRAGRELILSGCVRAHVLQITLIDTLQFLAKRYEREAIGALASALVTALLQHLGISG